jgi:hypothetical protein
MRAVRGGVRCAGGGAWCFPTLYSHEQVELRARTRVSVLVLGRRYREVGEPVPVDVVASIEGLTEVVVVGGTQDLRVGLVFVARAAERSGEEEGRAPTGRAAAVASRADPDLDGPVSVDVCSGQAVHVCAALVDDLRILVGDGVVTAQRSVEEVKAVRSCSDDQVRVPVVV